MIKLSRAQELAFAADHCTWTSAVSAPFVANVARTDLGKAFVEDVRFAPGELTRREARQMQAQIDRDFGPIREEMETLAVPDVTDEAERFVVDDLTRQLEATGGKPRG